MSRSNDIANITASVLDGVTKAEVGLGNVDNTADSAKPVSTAQQSAIDGLAYQSVPHIIPGVLYPAVSGNDIHGTDIDTSHGSTYTYGTTHTDGRKYYHTDIKGSKPIKDPRIGGHFGSQRHKTKSLQLLEQETATHGKNVYSIDGREWIRGCGTVTTANDGTGDRIYIKDAASPFSFIEITGYFSDINIIGLTDSGFGRSFTTAIDGGTASAENTSFETSANTPLGSRYVDAGSVVNLGLGATLGIHTLKITAFSTEEYPNFYGIELIAQDKFTDATCDYNNDPTITMDSTAKLSVGLSVSGTGIPSGATVSSITNSTTFELSESTTGGAVTNGTLTFGGTEISIPAQDVVSYGKKHSITHVSHHYDPFNGFTSGSSVTSYIDTATSLGVEKWKNSSTYYRPYNGGRVVKWVDSSGVIKTSVTLMPPNAKSIGDSSSLTNGTAKVNASASNDTFYPTFEAHTTDVNEDNLHEVAKTFHFREFGNGSANGSSSYSDPSTLVRTAGTHNTAFVMDDGLTSLSCFNMYDYSDYGLRRNNAGDVYFTFIGTGLTITGKTYTHTTIAQNLPYGTHVFRQLANGSSGNGDGGDWFIDGVKVKTLAGSGGAVNELGNYGILEFPIYQPKRPPIPEDACVISDYMLMADFVPNTTQGIEKISKGSRLISASRDFFHDTAYGTLDFTQADRVVSSKGGMTVNYVNPGVNEVGPELTWFGDAKMVNEAVQISDSTERSKHYFDGSTTDVVVTSDYTDSGAITTGLPSSSEAHYCVYGTKTSGVMGKQVSKFVAHPDDASNDWLYYSSAQVATPIHTSHHYQSFETPFLHELVGGDRNMEQTNLVVSPDGKTWDEVTRDTSYLGNLVFTASRDGGDLSNESYIYDWFRGNFEDNNNNAVQKEHWAIAYDRLVCLVDGTYEIYLQNYFASADGDLTLNKNVTGNSMATAISYVRIDPADTTGHLLATHHFVRGDFINIYVAGSTVQGSYTYYNNIQIKKI